MWPALWIPSKHNASPLCALQSLLPPDIVDQQRIRAQLTTALNLMNAAAESSTLPAGQRWAAIDEATEAARANAAAEMGPTTAPVAPTAAKFVADGDSWWSPLRRSRAWSCCPRLGRHTRVFR